MAYEIVLDKFSGPLDLLLHLIQKQEVNIHDIPIATITDQYLAYLRAMEELSLDVASEFVVMAATLLAIKSRMLLPKPPKAELVEGEDIDPREQLVQQLLEYQRCKWAADQLKERELLQSQIFSREPMSLEAYVPEEPPRVEGVSMWDLVDAYRKMLLRVPKEEQIAEIKGEVVSVEIQMETMLQRLRRWPVTTFFQMIQTARTRHEVVANFLALLELIKTGAIQCTQILSFGDIEIRLVEERNP
jgi:segregation and condensation protein A